MTNKESRLLEIDYEGFFGNRGMFCKTEVISLIENHGKLQDTKSVKAKDKETLELLTSTCPHDKKGFPKADCSLCVWELVEALKRGIDEK